MAKLWRVDDRWGQLSLVQQFVLGSLVVVLVSIAAVGWWVGNQIEAGVIHRTAGATALYVESFIGPQIQFLEGTDSLSDQQIATLDRLLAETPLGQEIVTLKVWGRGGRVLYSTTHDLIGQQFAPREKGRRAWAGEIVAGVSNLEEDENVGERGRFTRLLEYYIPVRLQGTDRIVAVAEFYQTVDALEAETAAAQLRSWLVVGLATLVTYLLLIGIVRRGSDTISRQQSELNSKISQLTALLSQNEELRERVQRAATRTTELNERFLRRISAELHDGPAQDMSLALLRLDSARSLMEDCSDSCPLHTNGQHGKELETVQFSLTRAL